MIRINSIMSVFAAAVLVTSLISAELPAQTVQAGLFNTNFTGPITLTVRAKATGGDLTPVAGGMAFTVTMRYLTAYGITVSAPTGSFSAILDRTITSGSYTYKVYSTVLLTTTASFLNGVAVDLFSVNITGGSGYGTFQLINDAVTSSNFVDWYFEYNINDYTNYVTPFYASSVSPVPLPVQLVAFDGNRVNDRVTLDWKTASELNNSGFYVERSADNSAWTQLDFVQGHGTTDLPHQYSYVDKLSGDVASLGTVYYRLRQLDRDGKQTYSSVIAIVRLDASPAVADTETAFLLTPYPNPFFGGMHGNAITTIPVKIDREQPITLYITDASGKVVQWMYTNEMLPAGSYRREFNASALPSGTYFAVLQAQGHVVRKQLVYTK
jgi:hypothetical protein